MGGGGGTPWGAIIGGLQENITGAANTIASHRFADQSWKRQKKVLQNQIQWRVNDMKAAGLNPILAAQSAFGGGAPSVATAQAGLQSGASGAARGAEALTKRSVRAANEASAQSALAAAELAGEKQNTEIAQQAALARQAELAANNAKVAETQNRLMKLGIPAAQGKSELWTDRVWREFMKAREFFGQSLPGLMGATGAGVSQLPQQSQPKYGPGWDPSGEKERAKKQH